MNNLDMNWQKTLSLFQGKLDDYGLDKITFDSFFTTLEIKDIVGSVVTITIDTKWSLDVVEPYLTHLQEIYNTVTNGHYQLHLMTEEDFQKSHVHQEHLLQFDDHLNPDLTFDNFVIGNSNRIAQNASLAVAMKPGVSYSPLFIHSNSGLGKTHLLNAIGNYAKKRDPSIHVLFTTSENFVNEYIQSLANHSMDEFNYKYRQMDILLIDDIQFMATKESSSEIFFNIFNTLISNKKQIVITSDKPPRDLKGMESRLVSRFSSGLSGLRRQRQRIRNLPDGFAERACPDALHFPGSFGRGDDRRPDHFAEGPGRYQDLGGSGPSGCRRRDVRFVGAGPEYRACFVVPRYRNRQCDAAGTEALARETLR